jgi:hypothetical protein
MAQFANKASRKREGMVMPEQPDNDDPMHTAKVRAQELLEQINGDRYEILIRYQLVGVLCESFIEDIQEAESWQMGDVLQQVVDLVRGHFRQLAARIYDNQQKRR